MRDGDEIDEQINEAMEGIYNSKWPGMTYEQGVSNALRWVTGEEETPPMEDD